MKRFSNVVVSVSEFFDKLGGWIYVGLMFLVVVNIILRAAFSSPIKGTVEYVGFYTAVGIAFSIAYCALKDGHIAVTFLAERLFSKKILKVIALLMNSISAFFFTFTGWKLAEYAAGMAASGEVSSTTRTHYFPYIYIIAFCFFLLAVVLLNRMIELFKRRKNN